MEPEPEDPFAWIMEGCQISSSEESRLNRCSYFGMSDSDSSGSDSIRLNPPNNPVAQTGITMVSPPNSPQEDQEIFHTPPESRSTSTSFDNCYDDRIIADGGTMVVDADSADSRRAVDSGRDTELGFLEVDSAQRIQANMNPDGTFRRESEEIRVSKKVFSPKDQLPTESLFKRLKSLDFESPSDPMRAPNGRNPRELLKSLNKGNFKNVSLSPGATEELELENQQNHESNGEVGEGSVRKRRLDTQIVGSDPEERNIERENINGETSNRGESLDFLTEGIEYNTEERTIESDQVRYGGEKRSNSCGMQEKGERKRVLPSWANNGRVEEKSERKRALPSWVNNGRVGDDESVDEELEDDETELSSCSNGRTEEDDERTDEELEVNETETIHLNTNSDNLREDAEKTTLLDVLLKLEEDSQKDSSLERLSLLEVAQRKWGAFF
ncbi:hypothetical protein PTKIN_Ptkin05aG0098700 [Pterospermum kingtungense]